MSNTETTDTPSEFFEIRIPKNLVKKVVTVTAAAAAVVGVVFVAKNLSIDTTEDSVAVELETA